MWESPVRALLSERSSFSAKELVRRGESLSLQVARDTLWQRWG